MNRPNWDQYFMRMAQLAAERGTCDRKKVGAVLVFDKRVLATGYNGAPRGWDDCSQVGHLMVKMGERESCVRTLHAEHNAVLQCAIHGVQANGATCYTTASPCFDCFKLLAQVGIKRIVHVEVYDGARMHGVNLVKLAYECGIQFHRLDLDPVSP